MAESIVGDITPLCGVSKEEKQRREMAAMREISNLIPPQGEHLMELFEVGHVHTSEDYFVHFFDGKANVCVAERDKWHQIEASWISFIHKYGHFFKIAVNKPVFGEVVYSYHIPIIK